MGKILRCREVGVWDCDFEARGESVEEIMQTAAKHVEEVHGVEEITQEIVAKVQATIRDE